MRVIQFDTEKKYIREFIRLPKRLYGRDNNMENPKDIQAILMNTHVMSKYFSLYKFLVCDGGKTVGRFAITAYDNDPIAYFGFFECEDDSEAAKVLFDAAYDFAKRKGFIKLQGPVDASFWMKYRLKINLFDRAPYTGEPYNLPYYKRLFDENGFRVYEHYVSNIYKIATAGFELPRYKEHYDEFLQKGYQIISPKSDGFADAMKEVYRLIIELYSDFPIFKTLSEEDFCSQFSDFTKIVNVEMVKMAYYEGKAVGFFISVPNYGNHVYHTNRFTSLIQILKKKKHPTEYVMLYMGVDAAHRGLGKALVQSIIDTLIEKELPSIGALMRDGKITQNYVEPLIANRYEYVLMEREI